MRLAYTITPHNPAHLWNHKLNIHKETLGNFWDSVWSKRVPHQMEPSWETSWAIFVFFVYTCEWTLYVNFISIDDLIHWSPDPN